MNKRKLTKNVVTFLLGYGTSYIAAALVSNYIPTPRLDHKITVSLVQWSAAGATAKALSNYTDEIIDTLFDAYEESKTA